MQHTQQDETILRTEPKEDIDDLIFRADPGWMVSEQKTPPPWGCFFLPLSLQFPLFWI